MTTHVCRILVCTLMCTLLVALACARDTGATYTSPAPPQVPDSHLQGKYGRGSHGGEQQVQQEVQQQEVQSLEGGAAVGSELLPQALSLRNPSSMHKRLYPRWYQAYVYKNPNFKQVPGPVGGGSKRFQPFHPLARFRGLSLGTSQYSSGHPALLDLPISDHSGHRLPTAPNAQPSLKYQNPAEEEVVSEEDSDDEVGQQVRAGELLQFLKTIASDRGLSSHTKGFRFGISRRK
ncbi:hypothetical protein OTU49_011847 [Cherax quadricarinatus]|uniref:Uncharacterized protein n=1 Tax=Cherax quadricarinatus TaxID=27406 RepID=A0AAW0W2Q3_CHEQU|nr:uncharacterized protein LOC128704902 isoform X2 [Cherax quadricarinatus]